MILLLDNKMLINYIKFILCFINVILFIVILIIMRKRNRETFVTWFKPYYQPNIKENPLLDTKEIYNENTLINQYDYNQLNFGIYQESNIYEKNADYFIKYMTKLILQNSNILDINLTKIKLTYNILLELNKGKLDIAFASSPILYDALVGTKVYNKKTLNNLRFICNINSVSIFFFVSKVGSVKSLFDLKGANIGVISNKSTSWKCASDITEQLDLKEKKDFNFKYYDLDTGLKMLNEGKIECYVYDTVFPSAKLKYYFENNIASNVYVLPLDELDEKIFTSRFFYYTPIYLDLNRLSKNYLPNVIGNYKFNHFKPMLKTYSFHNYLLCNHKLRYGTGYNLIKSIYNNTEEINKLDLFKNSPLFKNNLAWTAFPISIHKGVKYFFYQKGYISYASSNTKDPNELDKENPNCLFLISKQECNKKNLDKLNVPPVDYTFL